MALSRSPSLPLSPSEGGQPRKARQPGSRRLLVPSVYAASKTISTQIVRQRTSHRITFANAHAERETRKNAHSNSEQQNTVLRILTYCMRLNMKIAALTKLLLFSTRWMNVGLQRPRPLKAPGGAIRGGGDKTTAQSRVFWTSLPKFGRVGLVAQNPACASIFLSKNHVVRLSLTKFSYICRLPQNPVCSSCSQNPASLSLKTKSG